MRTKFVVGVLNLWEKGRREGAHPLTFFCAVRGGRPFIHSNHLTEFPKYWPTKNRKKVLLLLRKNVVFPSVQGILNQKSQRVKKRTEGEKIFFPSGISHAKKQKKVASEERSQQKQTQREKKGKSESAAIFN